MKVTHVLFAVGLTGVLGIWRTLWGPLIVIPASIGSIAPDADLGSRHRMLLHNIFILFMLMASSWFTTVYSDLELSLLLLAFIIGWISHIVLDLLTLKGVALLYPVSKRFYGFKKCRSDSLLCNGLFSLISIVMIIYGVKSFIP
jgi:inner membrane protein